MGSIRSYARSLTITNVAQTRIMWNMGDFLVQGDTQWLVRVCLGRVIQQKIHPELFAVQENLTV